MKIRAELLHKRASANDEASLRRLQRLPDLRDVVADEEARSRIQRKHCLAIVARELGFVGFPHALRVLEGELSAEGAGTLFSPPRCHGFLNAWFSDVHEARALLMDQTQFLLAYKRHYFVVGTAYLVELGLDPGAREWIELRHDWTHEPGTDARRRLYAQLFAVGGKS
ncbi:hypothetical protein AKJ09_10700 [Labilithrix luteola]|uniref:Uncharacterized protein n=1 Tax=Labilithrix luteola TaxID=1391654 RepID=A0A0K1QEE3_9BACT|nr:hypothetical protein AKJ09_10700 [Labilithrix luteola]